MIACGSGLGAAGVMLMGSCLGLSVDGVGLCGSGSVHWALSVSCCFISSTILARIFFICCFTVCVAMNVDITVEITLFGESWLHCTIASGDVLAPSNTHGARPTIV